MKFDSDYIDLDIEPEFLVLHGKTENQVAFDIWSDGDICFDDNSHFTITYLEMNDIVRAYKLYRDRRIAYMNKKS